MVTFNKSELKIMTQFLEKFIQIDPEGFIISDGEKITFKTRHKAGHIMGEAVVKKQTEKFSWFLSFEKLVKILKRCPEETEIVDKQNSLLITTKKKTFPEFNLLQEEGDYKTIPVVNYTNKNMIAVEKVIEALADTEAADADEVKIKKQDMKLMLLGINNNSVKSETFLESDLDTTTDEIVLGYEHFKTLFFDFSRMVRINWQKDKPLIIEYEKGDVSLKFALAPRME